MKLDRKYIPSVIVTVICLVILGFVIYWMKDLAVKFEETALEIETQFGSIKVKTKQLNVPRSKVRTINPDTNYIDSGLGFAFEKPTNKEWSYPTPLRSFDDLIQAMSFRLAFAQSLTSNLPIQLLMLSPMIENGQWLRIVSSKQIKVEFSDEQREKFTNELIKSLSNVSQIKSLLAKWDAERQSEENGETPKRKESKKSKEKPNDKATKNKNKKSIKDVWNAIFTSLPKTFTLRNEFLVHVYLKKYLKKEFIGSELIENQLTLPNFFLILGSNLGLNLEKLTADEGSILTGGTYIFRDVKIGQKKTDIQYSRYYHLTEGPIAFYVVEIGYSSATGSSIERWEDLQKMVDSFRIIVD